MKIINTSDVKFSVDSGEFVEIPTLGVDTGYTLVIESPEDERNIDEYVEFLCGDLKEDN